MCFQAAKVVEDEQPRNGLSKKHTPEIPSKSVEILRGPHSFRGPRENYHSGQAAISIRLIR